LSSQALQPTEMIKPFLSTTFSTLFATALGLGIVAPAIVLATPSPLKPVALEQLPTQLGWDDQIWGKPNFKGDRQQLIAAVDHSLRYLSTAKSVEAYRSYPVSGITHDRVRRSLIRFRQLLVVCRSMAELQTAVRREFVFYQSPGKDEKGTVAFTGYFEPVHRASRLPTATYRYPLYRLPPNLQQWEKPHPTRSQLEGEDGLQGSKGRLKGLESLSVPVTAERSIATDKTQFPPGALALIQTQIPDASSTNKQPWVNRYVLDQDTGGAIIGPGRVDIFMGTGIKAGERAGLINVTGRLYYLLLKE
jgi:membrane-bound lytic murein transglycosylase